MLTIQLAAPLYQHFPHCWVPHIVQCVRLPMVLGVQSLVECSVGSLGDVLPLRPAWRTVKTWQAKNSFAFVFEEFVANMAWKSLKLPQTVKPVISSHLTFLQDLTLPKNLQCLSPQDVIFFVLVFCRVILFFLSVLSAALDMFCFLLLSLWI